MLETLIASQIFRQFTILGLGLNFITHVNCEARWKYSFGHANLCLNPLVISMLIRKVFQVKRTMDVHMEVYTITTGRPCTCVLIPLRNICDFSVISKVKRRYKYHYLSLFYKRIRNKKRIKESCSSYQNTNNSRFSISTTLECIIGRQNSECLLI